MSSYRNDLSATAVGLVLKMRRAVKLRAHPRAGLHEGLVRGRLRMVSSWWTVSHETANTKHNDVT